MFKLMSTFYRVQFWRPYHERFRGFSEPFFPCEKKNAQKYLAWLKGVKIDRKQTGTNKITYEFALSFTMYFPVCLFL